MDAALEVAVAGEHRDHGEVLTLDLLRDLVGERAAVADAGGAAVADEVEAERVQRLEQAGALEVVGDHPRPGREAGLDVVGGAHAALDGALGEQARADHHRRVRGVRARGDRRDHHRAVAQPGPRLGMPGGMGMLAGGRGMAALALEAAELAVALGGHLPVAELCRERLPHPAEGDPVLGTAGTGEARLHGREVEVDHLAEARDLVPVGAEHALLAAVALDEVDVGGVTAALAQISQGLGVDGEERGGGAELRRHVRHRRPVGGGQG